MNPSTRSLPARCVIQESCNKAAEAFQTAREPRPYRAALSDAAAAANLRRAVREGKLCPEAVEGALTAAGQPARRDATERLAGMTPREIEVLRLIAAGHTAKEAARRLDIAPKTADNHIQSLYAKIGVSTRAGAALYALERGLVQQGISAI
jgi:DNA-binding NarL/FixJ family response regulator